MLVQRRSNLRIFQMTGLFLLGSLLSAGLSAAQSLPEGVTEVPFVCPPREARERPEPMSEEERLEALRRARYREVFPAFLAAVPQAPDTAVLMPVEGVRVRDVVDTWGAARSEGRVHEGTDIFAPAGTPIYSATEGFIYRIGEARRGGQTVTVVGGGGRRYYYAHLSAYADDIQEGQFVTPETLLGFVGNSGNAQMTPPHLHLGIYDSETDVCDWEALNPYPLLADRD